MQIDLQESKGKTIVYKSERDLKFKGLEKLENTGLCDTPFTMICNGKPSSGKSLFCENLIRNHYCVKGKKTCFSYIAYCCPESSQGSYENSFIGDLNPDDVYDNISTQILEEIVDKAYEIKENGTKKNPKFSLLILDDLGSELRQGGKDGGVKKFLKRLLQNYRHLHMSVVICCQTYMSLSSDHRNLCRLLVQWQTNSVIELERLWAEWGSSLTKKQFIEDFWPYIFDEKYNFLQFDRHRSTMCKNYNLLDIKKI